MINKDNNDRAKKYLKYIRNERHFNLLVARIVAYWLIMNKPEIAEDLFLKMKRGWKPDYASKVLVYLNNHKDVSIDPLIMAYEASLWYLNNDRKRYDYLYTFYRYLKRKGYKKESEQ